ncbi:NAD-dependent DNA ligase LigA [Candidatus Riflebacteria bacterium]
MESQKILQEIERLREEIRKHNYLYYVKSAPIISDQEFDHTYKRLKELVDRYPQFQDTHCPTQRVGEAVTSFKTKKHEIPMLSLDNTYSKIEIEKWLQKVKKLLADESDDELLKILLELKIDGVSCSLIYRNGKLEAGITRGDGEYGDLITANVRAIHPVPLTIEFKEELEVRGEIYLPRSQLLRINAERVREGTTEFKNCRNLASGTIKNLDPAMVEKRGLSFFAYEAFVKDPATAREFTLQSQIIEFLKEQNFSVNEHTACIEIKEIFTCLDHLAKIKDGEDYDVDGVVIKVNSRSFQDILGTTSKYPRWAIAYKFPQKRASTVLLDVIWQVGRKNITPVAFLKGVELEGTTVRKASLHNVDYLKEKDIKINDVVLIEKSGFIIPQVVEVDFSARKNRDVKDIKIPSVCPACLNPLCRIENRAALICPNEKCSGRLERKVLHFIKAVQLENVGQKLVSALVEHSVITEIPDLFRITEKELEKLPLMGEKKINIITGSINAARKIPFSRFIWSLGIPQVGEVVARDLADYVFNLEKLLQISEKELSCLEGVGPVIAREVINFLQGNKLLLEDLLTEIEIVYSASADKVVMGKGQIVITGELSLPRKEWQELLFQKGWQLGTSVSKKTKYLVTNEEKISTKLKKAKSLKIPIINEMELKKIMALE